MLIVDISTFLASILRFHLINRLESKVFTTDIESRMCGSFSGMKMCAKSSISIRGEEQKAK